MRILNMVGASWQRFGEHCLTNRISKRMLFLEPYRAEGVLIICSLWAAFVLYNPPSNFASFPASFAIAERMQGSEAAWATLALVGALLKMFGLVFLGNPRLAMTSFVLRVAGLVVSGIFWMIMGISATIGNFDSLFGVPGFMMGVTAVWILFRFPVSPTDV